MIASATKTLLAFCLLVVIFTGCDTGFSEDDPPPDAASVFDVFWEDLDRLYALFPVKNVDWDSLKSVYQPEALDATGPELEAILCEMIHVLNDGHVVLYMEDTTCVGDRSAPPEPSDINFTFIEAQLQEAFRTEAQGRFRYGVLQSGNIGYLHIGSFEGGMAPVSDWTNRIDGILADLTGIEGMIIDVRDNVGGNGFNATAIAGRFIERPHAFLITQSRNGPEPSDLTRPQVRFVEPAGDRPLTDIPILVLTNHNTFSAGEWFVLAMREAPQVTTIGTATRGGLSSRIFRGLPNGWSYSVSIQLNTSIDGSPVEGIGIMPDSLVFPERGRIPPRDAIFSTALRILREN